MNLHTFKDVVNAKKSSLANDLDDEDDDDVGMLRDNVEGEEDDGDEKFNDAGEAIEPFNLKDERESGHIDANMNFVFQKEKSEVDAWVAGLDEAAMEQAIGEAAAAMKRRQAKIQNDEVERGSKVERSTSELKQEILTIVRPGETIVRALNRLSGKQTKLANRGRNKSAEAANVEASSSADKQLVNRLIEAADALISAGLVGVYEMSYESVDASMAMWEYLALDGSVQGPYTSQQIAAWKAQGFFTGASAVQMRRVGNPASSAVSAPDRSGESLKRPSSLCSHDDGTSKKKVRHEEATAAMDDLIGDLDDDDDGNEAAVSSDSVDTALATTTATGAATLGGSGARGGESRDAPGPWISSDDVDFGSFVDLRSDRPGAVSRGVKAPVGAHTAGGDSSGRSSVRLGEPGAMEGVREEDEEDDEVDDDGEDDDDDADASAGWSKGGRSNKSSRAKAAMNDDSD